MDSWWVDSGSTTHISMSLQGCLWSRRPSNAERFIYVGDGNKVSVEAIGSFSLLFKTGCYLDLFETFVAPFGRQNLISIYILDNLYMLDIERSSNEILQIESRGTKHKFINNSATLWHKRLGHISKQRIQRLVSEGILEPLDMSDFEVCIQCIKGKQTDKRNFNAERAKDVLELIHTDICGPFPSSSWNGQRCFITFIDDYSRYDYLYLIHEKSQSLDMFKSFKAEVELRLGKKIKAVKSDRGGEYYGWYDGSGEQRPRPFTLFLKECGIVPQCTMLGKPSMNRVAER